MIKNFKSFLQEEVEMVFLDDDGNEVKKTKHTHKDVKEASDHFDQRDGDLKKYSAANIYENGKLVKTVKA